MPFLDSLSFLPLGVEFKIFNYVPDFGMDFLAKFYVLTHPNNISKNQNLYIPKFSKILSTFW